MVVLPPRVVVAGTSSGVGKTTFATGLMAALRRHGHRVASAKVGPDYIDPGYHAVATGRPGRNLDAWMSGGELIAPLAGRAAAGCDLLVVEGVMGMFDGASDGTPSSTADVARFLSAPVLLVVDCGAQSASAAAMVHGFATLDPTVEIAGVLLNGIASDAHESSVREALGRLPYSLPVVGVLRRNPQLQWRERHLGLVPVVEQTSAVAASVDALADHITEGCDLAAIEAIARRAPTRLVEDVPRPRHVGAGRVAVATGGAFSFAYPDNLEALEAAGATLVEFDPSVAAELPADCQGLVVGGGFPEVWAAELGRNARLLEHVRQRIADGLVTWAECGGMLWLCRTLDANPMVGALDADAHMTERLTLGYRAATTTVSTPFGPAGTELRGHEFHYSTVEPQGDALRMHRSDGTPVVAGFASPTLLASYLHIHLAARPELAEAFVRSVAGATTA